MKALNQTILLLALGVFAGPRPALAAEADAGAADAKAPETAAAPAPDEAPWGRSPIKDWSKTPKPGKEPRWTPPQPKSLKLKNGIRLLVVERHALPLVEAVLVVRGAGAASDPEGKAGLASFTADLLDEGAGGLGALALAAELERVGATLNTSVDRDAGFVTLSTLRRTLTPSLDLFSKVVTAPALDPKDAARLHQERLTDLKLRVDRPREVAEVVLGTALYGRSAPYGHPVAGFVDTFEKVGLPDVKDFYAVHWQPSQMTLVVTGDVKAVEVKRLLDAGLGAWKPQKVRIPKARWEKPPKTGSRLLMVERAGAPQSDIRVGLVGLPRSDTRYYAFQVLNTVLGGGFTSRLNHRLREELGYTYGIGSGMDWRLSPGPFVIGSSIFTPKTADSVKEIVRIVGELAKKPVPQAELEKARQGLVRALPMRFETNGGVAAAFADLAEAGLPTSWYRSYQKRIRRVTAAQVRKVARTVIPAGRLVFVVVGDVPKLRGELESELGPALLYQANGQPEKVELAPGPSPEGGPDAGTK